MKKWLYAVLAGIIITPILAFSWQNIVSLWAAPEKIAEVAKKQEKQASSLEQIAQLSMENKNRQDKEEAISNLQIQALKDQLVLISDLKKK